MTTPGALRRFVAGAICPECKSEDTIYLIGSGRDEQISCTDCDFSESMQQPPAADKAQKTPVQVIDFGSKD